MKKTDQFLDLTQNFYLYAFYIFNNNLPNIIFERELSFNRAFSHFRLTNLTVFRAVAAHKIPSATAGSFPAEAANVLITIARFHEAQRTDRHIQTTTNCFRRPIELLKSGIEI